MNDHTVLLSLVLIFIIAQYFFIKQKSKIAGIVLPVLWFSGSAVPVIFFCIVSHYTNLGKIFFTVKYFNSTLLTLLIYNIPTFIMLAMLFLRIRKEKRVKKSSAVPFFDIEYTK
ncbi:MAG: hypothetical protein CVU97_01820 [Firmicutes bacterium HGW-Firmicutes-21]|nr:MAG: hypothetical protein CVU97_01820 [Firmicutes bacterium HGW-Firmicutes-21]